jgi:hypothetical protein
VVNKTQILIGYKTLNIQLDHTDVTMKRKKEENEIKDESLLITIPVTKVLTKGSLQQYHITYATFL